ncbi:hypothetical protein [Pseudonocardia spinosispora]|uniref:hypothetical protein n=1 Tax=Pseudonocardia spinosispora TaxID=103441 RepID=UPI0003F64176|nr:hypothetical protein [Pseudonocardia spinosispora]
MARETNELLSRRDMALLNAVADRRCEIVYGAKPLLFMDGRAFPDREAARRLIRAGLVAQPGIGTGRWPARLTDTGRIQLSRATD